MQYVCRHFTHLLYSSKVDSKCLPRTPHSKTQLDCVQCWQDTSKANSNQFAMNSPRDASLENTKGVQCRQKPRKQIQSKHHEFTQGANLENTKSVQYQANHPSETHENVSWDIPQACVLHLGYKSCAV